MRKRLFDSHPNETAEVDRGGTVVEVEKSMAGCPPGLAARLLAPAGDQDLEGLPHQRSVDRVLDSLLEGLEKILTM